MSGKRSLIRSRIEKAIAPRKEKYEDDDDGDLTRARVVGGSSGEEEDEELKDVDIRRSSKLRTRNAPKLSDFDPRYRGKKSSRESLRRERGGLDEKEHDGADLGHMFEMSEEEDEEGIEEEEEEEGEADDDDDDEGENEGGSSEEEEVEEQGGISRMSESNIANEIKKGQAIKDQLLLWENLMELRIQMQKVLTKVNRYPRHDVWKEFKSRGGEQYRMGVKKAQGSVVGVLDELLGIQVGMINSSSEMVKYLKRERSDEEEEDEAAVPTPKKKMRIAEYSSTLEALHKSMVPYRNDMIEKWNDKTRLAAGAVVGGGGGGGKSFAGFETSVLRQIEHILSDSTRLVARTQTKRSSYRTLGTRPPCDDQATSNAAAAAVPALDPEIFDDDDFYHQLLRELIDRKSADITDPTQLGKHWLQVQKMRSKMKRSLDTKASKGRKTRYDIHAKLVNFMAPQSYSSWKDEAKNELFSSLFGNLAK